jgi:hypothetical protein
MSFWARGIDVMMRRREKKVTRMKVSQGRMGEHSRAEIAEANENPKLRNKRSASQSPILDWRWVKALMGCVAGLKAPLETG